MPAESDPEVLLAPVGPAPLDSPPPPGAPNPTREQRAAWASPPPEPVRKRRAVAGRGAVIISQDGHTVYYKKKCFQCGTEDGCRSCTPINNGIMRNHFFCPKCRKQREVHLQGFMQ
jgi:hypothetical protein